LFRARQADGGQLLGGEGAGDQRAAGRGHQNLAGRRLILQPRRDVEEGAGLKRRLLAADGDHGVPGVDGGAQGDP
jgi:hypothetical protein